MRKPIKKTPDQSELRRWCVEQAMRWPIETRHPSGMYAQIGGQQPTPQVHQAGGTFEADIIGRAKRIFDWVTSR